MSAICSLYHRTEIPILVILDDRFDNELVIIGNTFKTVYSRCGLYQYPWGASAAPTTVSTKNP